MYQYIGDGRQVIGFNHLKESVCESLHELAHARWGTSF